MLSGKTIGPRRRLIEAVGERALIDDILQISCTIFHFTATLFHIPESIFGQHCTGNQEVRGIYNILILNLGRKKEFTQLGRGCDLLRRYCVQLSELACASFTVLWYWVSCFPEEW
jgi:hypothetical protein